jgi:hypothetical protein
MMKIGRVRSGARCRAKAPANGAVTLLMVSIGCGGTGGEEEPSAGGESCVAAGALEAAVASPPTETTLPPTEGGFDYQLGCAYAVPPGATLVVRDRAAPADPDVYSICYVNAFQTQPGSDWSGPRDDLILRDSEGRKVNDPGWTDEYLLDISTPERRTRLVEIVGSWIAECAIHGFDAVELDNLDSHERSRGRLTEPHADAYAAELIAIAHRNLLTVAQKNAAQRSAHFHALGFDFAIVEECWKYDECADYTAEYDAHVLDIEYDESAFDRGCRAARAPAPLLRDVELVAPGRGYVRRECR